MSQQEISISPEQNTDWRIPIEKILEEARKAETPDAWDEVCIHRVPRKLRDVNPSAFDPQIVSIGPYHRGKDVLRDMDVHKKRCFRKILNRNNQEASLYFDSISEVVEKAKRCYEGNINLSIHEFVETMVLDGCFLLQILSGFSDDETYFERMGYSKNDPVYSKRGPIEVMKEDMLKLENQLPLFILGRLLGLISKEGQDKTDLVAEKVLEFFELKKRFQRISYKFRHCSHCLHIYRCGLLPQFQPDPSPTQGVCRAHRCICVNRWWGLCTWLVGPVYHLCTQIRRCLVGTEESFFISKVHMGVKSKAPRPSAHQRVAIHSPTKLREAGVKFKKGKSHCFVDIKYKAGVLCIPELVLDDTMKRLIHNLIAFEQTYQGPDNRHEITSYAVFMGDLINTSDDAASLHDLGIIVPLARRGYDEAVYFFNQITDGVIFDKEGLGCLRWARKGLLKKMNDYHNSRIGNWKVGIKHKYFGNPWSIISLIAAIALLVLTFLQTFYAMYGYYRPRH